MSKLNKIIKTFAIMLAGLIILAVFNTISYGLSLFINENNPVINYKEEYKEIKNIKIDTITSNIIIKKGNNYLLEASNIPNTFKSSISGDTLLIKEEKLHLFNNNESNDITIYIKEEKLNNLIIEIGAGKIILEELHFLNASIDNGAGTLEIKNSKFDKVNIDIGLGKTSIINSNLNNANIDTGLSNVLIDGAIMGNSKINCGIGTVDLNLIDETLYTLKFNNSIGNIYLNNKKSNKKIIGNGLNIIEIDGGIGRINVEFKQNL